MPRVRLTDQEAIKLGKTLNKKPKGRNKAEYRLTEEEVETVKSWVFEPNKREMIETIRKLDKDGEIISSTQKLQSKPLNIPEGFKVVKISTSETTGQQWVQYVPKEESKESYIDFESIIKKHIKRIKLPKAKIKNEIDFETLTYTDVHIGMDTDKYKKSMYPVDWNKESILHTCKEMINDTLANQKCDTLYVDELGDFLDGFNGLTTRGGHALPQNMTNEEAFDCALEFKMMLMDALVPHYSKLVFNNICNDNHAGSFGYFVNKAFKDIADIKYDNVEVVNHLHFMNHYFVNDICFVVTHGKDDTSLKFGFKPHLDSKQIEKIDQYLKQNKIYGRCERIIFKKGDSHQLLFDMCGSDDFDYYNYPALSPSSQWVQTNFKKGRRGYVIEHFKGINNEIKPKLSS